MNLTPDTDVRTSYTGVAPRIVGYVETDGIINSNRNFVFYHCFGGPWKENLSKPNMQIRMGGMLIAENPDAGIGTRLRPSPRPLTPLSQPATVSDGERNNPFFFHLFTSRENPKRHRCS